MRLLVIRHAIAVSRARFAATGQSDDLRPLTKGGRARMQLGARGLVRVAPQLDLLASSPLERARQTARIVAAAYDGIDVEETDVLRPEGSATALQGWLREKREHSMVGVVGHDTHLSEMVSWLLTGERGPLIELKKGGACLLELGETPRRGRARLLWSLAPMHLRRLGRGR